jgi:hypothetical protein
VEAESGNTTRPFTPTSLLQGGAVGCLAIGVPRECSVFDIAGAPDAWFAGCRALRTRGYAAVVNTIPARACGDNDLHLE